jgi:hypothetical protein
MHAPSTHPLIKGAARMISAPLCCLAILIVAASGPADDQKKAKSVAEQIAAIKKDHQERENKFYKDLGAARNDGKKIQELNDEQQKFTEKQAQALKALIKAHARDPAVFDGFLVLMGELRYYLDDDLIDLLRAHHLTNPKMGQLCFELMHRSSDRWAEELLEGTAAKHPRKNVKGQALYALGIYHRHRAQPYRENLTEAEQDKRFAQAARYFTEVTREYANVTTPDGKQTLGKKAGSELLRIKNLPFLRVGKKAPEIVGEDIEGKPFKLSEFRGKVVLLDFWGNW